MTIHKDGLGTIAAIWLFCGLLIYLSLHFIAYQFISYPISAILIFFMIFVFFFFRIHSIPIPSGQTGGCTPVRFGDGQ